MNKSIDLAVIDSAVCHLYEVENVLTQVIDETNETYLNGDFENLRSIRAYLNGLKKELETALQTYNEISINA